MHMRSIAKKLVEKWHVKLVCLLLASVLWYIIRQNVNQTPTAIEWPDSAASVESKR